MSKKLLTLSIIVIAVAGCANYYRQQQAQQKNQQKAQQKKRQAEKQAKAKQSETGQSTTKSPKNETPQNTTQVTEITPESTSESAPEINSHNDLAQNQPTELANDDFSLTGTYQWTFHLGFIKQESIHSFYPEYIDYRMRGKAHSTDYRMNKLSYDDARKKWIGQSEDGTVYVLFFKDISEQAISLYKHKCAQGEEGIAEATAFARPADDETKDHGWNVYTAEGIAEQEDVLPLAGIYHTEDLQTSIQLHDKEVVYKDTSYTKLTHHTGEKRWVGQADGELLVVFYQPMNEESDSVELAIEVFDTSGENGAENEEKAYKIKHDEQTYQTFQAK